MIVVTGLGCGPEMPHPHAGPDAKRVSNMQDEMNVQSGANAALNGWYIRSHIPGEIKENVPEQSAKGRILQEVVDFLERHIDGKRPYARELPHGERDLIIFSPRTSEGTAESKNRKVYILWGNSLYVSDEGVFGVDGPFIEELSRKLKRYSVAGSGD
jgi:hypothetical protein